MKRILFFLLLAALHFSVQAQHYQSIFGKQSTSWIIAWSNLPGTFQSTIAVQKDTIVNNLAYKKVILQGVPVGTGYYDGGLLREDTITGKVWYKKLYPEDPQFPFDTSEVLAFDYSLSVGDTFDISGAGFVMPINYPDSFNVVKRVYYQNNQKYIEFKGPSFEPFTMIEGIGGNFGVIWRKYSGYMQGHYLLCLYKDGAKTSYTNLYYQGQCSITGISEDNPVDHISIYPNPAQEKLSILNTSPWRISSMQVLNILGKRMPLNKISGEQSLNISSLPAGVYFIQIHLSNNQIFTTRFQKR